MIPQSPANKAATTTPTINGFVAPALNESLQVVVKYLGINGIWYSIFVPCGIFESMLEQDAKHCDISTSNVTFTKHLKTHDQPLTVEKLSQAYSVPRNLFTTDTETRDK